MTTLFLRPNGTPMQFHLAELPEKIFEHFKGLIEKNGGKVETEANENVLTFTIYSHRYQFKFVFDVRFIEDCLKFNKILNINDYYIGDSRISPECEMSKLATGNGTCLWYLRGLENLVPNPLHVTEFSFPDEVHSENSEDTHLLDKTVEIHSKSDELNVSSSSEENTSGSDTIILSSGSSEAEESDYVPNPEFNASRANEKENESQEPTSRYCRLAITKSPGPSSTKSKHRRLSALESLKDKSETKKLIEWGEKINKDVAKDEFGFPIEASEEYEYWKLRIIDFLIKSNRIHEGKAVNTWAIARNLKILPRNWKIGKMRSIFVTTILHHIEEFKLPPDVTKKFIDFRNFGRTIIREPLNKLEQWAEKVTKNKEKDEFGHPIGDDIIFQPWEQKIIVDFLVETGNIHKAKSSNTWQLVCNLKILPVHRTKVTVDCEFRFNILPNIESFQLHQVYLKEFIKLRSYSKFIVPSRELKKWSGEITKEMSKDEFGFPISTNRMIEDWEKQVMVDFIVQTNNFDMALAPSTWCLAQNLKLFPKHRTEQSLANVFRYQILPIIEEFNIPEDFKECFNDLRNSRVPMFEPTEEMKEWAKKISENLPKNMDNNKEFDEWEKKLMIDFLIKWNCIEKGKSRSTWMKLDKLKILPECRTSMKLATEFYDNILPFIEQYELPKEIEAQFVKLRTTTRTYDAVVKPRKYHYRNKSRN